MTHFTHGITPPALKPGDTIGFFSPSSPATHFAKRRTARACNYLTRKGFKLRAGALTGAHEHYRSGTVLARAEELNALLRDPDVRCVLSTIGGLIGLVLGTGGTWLATARLDMPLVDVAVDRDFDQDLLDLLRHSGALP